MGTAHSVSRWLLLVPDGWYWGHFVLKHCIPATNTQTSIWISQWSRNSSALPERVVRAKRIQVCDVWESRCSMSSTLQHPEAQINSLRLTHLTASWRQFSRFTEGTSGCAGALNTRCIYFMGLVTGRHPLGGLYGCYMDKSIKICQILLPECGFYAKTGILQLFWMLLSGACMSATPPLFPGTPPGPPPVLSSFLLRRVNRLASS